MSKTITLKHPVTVGGKQIDSVEIARPTVKNLKEFDKPGGEFQQMFNLMSELTGLLDVELDAIDAEDYMAMTDVVDGFLGSGQGTGES